jgi:hypothetical protein
MREQACLLRARVRPSSCAAAMVVVPRAWRMIDGGGDRRMEVEIMGTSTATLRLKGSGEHLRLRVAKAPDPLANVRECCRASVAVEKAMGEAIPTHSRPDVAGPR